MRQPSVSAPSRLAASAIATAPRRVRWRLARALDPAAARWVQGRWHSRRAYSLQGMQRRNCIFVHVPKCAGVSMAETLFGDRGAAHATFADYLYVFGARWTDQAFKFAFVRHPAERLVSAFEFLRAGGLHEWDARFAERKLARFADVEDFALNGLGDPEIRGYHHFRDQLPYLIDPRTGRIGVDVLGRFERLEADFAEIRSRLGVETPLAERNRAPKEKAAPELTGAALARVREVYRRDFDALGYVPDADAAPASRSRAPAEITT